MWVGWRWRRKKKGQQAEVRRQQANTTPPPPLPRAREKDRPGRSQRGFVRLPQTGVPVHHFRDLRAGTSNMMPLLFCKTREAEEGGGDVRYPRGLEWQRGEGGSDV